VCEVLLSPTVSLLIPAGIAVLWPAPAQFKHLQAPQSLSKILSIIVSRDGRTLEVRSSVMQRRHVDVTMHDSLTVCGSQEGGGG